LLELVRCNDGSGIAIVRDFHNRQFEEVVVVIHEVECPILGAVTWLLEPKAQLRQICPACLEFEGCDAEGDVRTRWLCGNRRAVSEDEGNSWKVRRNLRKSVPAGRTHDLCIEKLLEQPCRTFGISGYKSNVIQAGLHAANSLRVFTRPNA
jgi:hypothetical protein